MPALIAAVDAAFTDRFVIAVASLFSFPDLLPLEDRHARLPIRFPYIPGFLSFREGPAIMRALSGLRQMPDLILVDGQGIAHPDRIGIASHIGVLLNIPTIGCAKSRLIGTYDEPGLRRGNSTPLTDHANIIGIVLRTRDNTAPLFVSPGHLIDHASSVRIVMQCLGKFRIPEPLRRADQITKILRRQVSE